MTEIGTGTGIGTGIGRERTVAMRAIDAAGERKIWTIIGRIEVMTKMVVTRRLIQYPDLRTIWVDSVQLLPILIAYVFGIRSVGEIVQ